jgi:hypothetical protein
MKPLLLNQHPRTPVEFPRPWVRFGRQQSVLRTTFRIPGDTSAILIPEILSPHVKQVPELRADRLWEHTCFEIFLRRHGNAGYVEFNFSPSKQWAAYCFEDYRSGMSNAEVEVPAVVSTDWPNRYELSARIELPHWADQPWEANFTAVIEAKDGTKSYWALAHPDGPPDFHDPACFVAQLPAIAHA